MGAGGALVTPKLLRALPWISGAVLVLGAVTFLEVKNRPEKERAAVPSDPVQVDREPQTVPPSPEARRVVAKFIKTAVARRNLAEAWKLSGPGIRQGLSRRQWMTGEIPVVPFDVDTSAQAPVKLESSYRREANFEVLLLPRSGSGDKPQLFEVTVRKFGSGSSSRWLVDYWAPPQGPGPHEGPTR